MFIFVCAPHLRLVIVVVVDVVVVVIVVVVIFNSIHRVHVT